MKFHCKELIVDKSKRLQWFIFVVMGKDFIKPDDEGNYDVKLTINGVEFKVDEAVNAMWDDFEHYTKHEAVAYVKEQFYDKLTDISEEIDAVKKRVLEKIGFSSDEIKGEMYKW